MDIKKRGNAPCAVSLFLGLNLNVAPPGTDPPGTDPPGTDPPGTDPPETHSVETDPANNYTRVFPGVLCWQVFHQYSPGRSRQWV
jgi:hypothetical protein